MAKGLEVQLSPSNEYSGLISFRTDQFDLLAVQGTLKSLLQHHSSKASILWCSAFFTVQLSHSYLSTRKTTALTRWTFVSKVMSLVSPTHPLCIFSYFSLALPLSPETLGLSRQSLLLSWNGPRLLWVTATPRGPSLPQPPQTEKVLLDHLSPTSKCKFLYLVFYLSTVSFNPPFYTCLSWIFSVP